MAASFELQGGHVLRSRAGSDEGFLLPNNDMDALVAQIRQLSDGLEAL